MAADSLPVTKKERALILIAGLVLGAVFLLSEREAFTSSEVAFADGSTSGLAIVPASCPSNPHVTGEGFGWTTTGSASCSCTSGTTLLTQTADGKGYTLAASTAMRRISRYNAFFCVENESTADSYFIPANSQTELDTFRTVSPTPTGVNVWGYTPYSQATYYSQPAYYSESSYYGEGGYWSSK